MPLGRKVDGGSNYKCSDFEDRERILERITMNITFEPCVKVQNENRKIFMISLGYYRLPVPQLAVHMFKINI
jgi:hypothetical protein